MNNLRMLYLLLLALTVLPLSAQGSDINQKEADLLKSWGFNSGAQGRLQFSAAVDELDEYQPWSPQTDDLELPEVLKTKPRYLQPVVISSRQQRDQ